MPSRARFATAMLVGVALSACTGGEGEDCNSGGPLGPLYCDQGLVCNTAAGYTCQRPGTVPPGGACDSNQLCAIGLWCDLVPQTCRPWLNEGDPCTNPGSCGPDRICARSTTMPTASCAPGPDGGTDGAIRGGVVVGQLTLPATTQARGIVGIYAELPPAGTPVAQSAIAGAGSASLTYQIAGVPAGTYFLLGFLDVDGSGGGPVSTPGDYSGWFGHNGDGNPPAAANVVVSDGQTVRFDFSLVVQ